MHRSAKIDSTPSSRASGRPVASGFGGMPMPLVASLLTVVLLCGCTSSGINRARKDFYASQLTEAETSLSEIDSSSLNGVLALMERGMIRHTSGKHHAAIRDWLDAAARIKSLDYISLSQKTASMVINDRTESYKGRPFERMLLHAYTLKSYLALGQWREAAVEARLIAEMTERLNGFPDDAYSHYLAGLAFELIRDFNGARIEYLQADKLTPGLRIDAASGRIESSDTAMSKPLSRSQPLQGELICLIGIGRVPPYPAQSDLAQNTIWGKTPYAEILINGKKMGRSYSLNTTGNLAHLTEKRIAVIKAAKTVTRVVVKDSIADSVSDNNPLLGALLRLFLFALEFPDTRHWGTLPQWLQVARIPFPEKHTSVEVVYKRGSGETVLRQTLLPIMASDRHAIVITRVL